MLKFFLRGDSIAGSRPRRVFLVEFTTGLLWRGGSSVKGLQLDHDL